MKVFFTTGRSSFTNEGETTPHYDYKDFFNWTRVTAYSCLKNTSFEPIFLYDGDSDDEFGSWFKNKLGIKVLSHRISFYDEIAKTENKSYIRVASGIYPRVDFPKVMERYNITDEKVLFVDTDTLFLSEGNLKYINTNTMAMAGQHDKNYGLPLNAGVILMNTNYMKSTFDDFLKYLLQNRNRFSGFDQQAYNEFYKGKIDHLPNEFNWKPYWGENENARLIHFHGPKPTDLPMMKEGKHRRVSKYSGLFHINKTNLSHYEKWVRRWEKTFDNMIKELGD